MPKKTITTGRIFLSILVYKSITILSPNVVKLLIRQSTKSEMKKVFHTGM